MSGPKDERHIKEGVTGTSPRSIADVSRPSPMPLTVFVERETWVDPVRV